MAHRVHSQLCLLLQTACCFVKSKGTAGILQQQKPTHKEVEVGWAARKMTPCTKDACVPYAYDSSRVCMFYTINDWRSAEVHGYNVVLMYRRRTPTTITRTIEICNFLYYIYGTGTTHRQGFVFYIKLAATRISVSYIISILYIHIYIPL